jgi:hypothetical protein
MSFNLLLVVARSIKLTPTDYLALVLMIDTQCVALSATLSSKDALASRWYVGLTLSGQAFAWGVILYANYQLPEALLLSSERNECLDLLWYMFAATPWGWSDGWEIVFSFKVYWYLHAFDFIHAGWLAMCHTKQFDALEKIDRGKHIDLIVGAHVNSYDTGFSRLRGTVFSNWISFALYPVILALTLENRMRCIEVSTWGEWGQMMPLLSLVCGVSHWIFVNWKQLHHYLHDVDYRSGLDNRKIFPYDITRRIAMGATPSDIGEENYKLLTAEKLE